MSVTVSNLSKDVVRVRDAAVKKVCVDNNIPLSNYNFTEVSPNEEGSDISASEGKYEEYEETDEEGSGSEAEEGNEDDIGGK